MKKQKSRDTKLFVLDTNVLMHDPSSLFRFEEHDIYLPMVTLEELDNNKKGLTEVAQVQRHLPRRLVCMNESYRGITMSQLSPGGYLWQYALIILIRLVVAQTPAVVSLAEARWLYMWSSVQSN